MAAFLVAIAGVYAVQAVQIRNHELAAADAVKHAVSEGEFTDVESIVGQMRGRPPRRATSHITDGGMRRPDCPESDMMCGRCSG